MLDCFSRREVGYSIAGQMRTELVANVLRQRALTALCVGPGQALRPPPDNIIDLDHFRVTRRDRIGGTPNGNHIAA